MNVVVKEVVKHSVMRFVSVACVGLVIAGIGYAGYITFWKPHFNPTATTTQRAEKIMNITYPEKKSLIDWKIWFVRVKIL